ncbi:MAG: calcium/sodium antiporter, partial [Halieaceae bacterium]
KKRINSVLLYSAVIAAGLVVLVWSADRFVDGASAIADRAGLSPMLIGLTIVSVGTSAPEILISVMSALADSGELAVGNALGSNIANIGLVLGATLVITDIGLRRSTVFTDLPLLVIVVLITWGLLSDYQLSLGDSLILLTLLVLFFLRIFRQARISDSNGQTQDIPAMGMARAWASFLGGLLLLIGSSRVLVWSASNIALSLGVSELVIGLTIVAVGTSLPELAASIASALKGQADMAIGAIVGSNMFNILLVLAIPGLWSDLSLPSAVVGRDMVAVFLTSFVLALAAAWRWNAKQQVSNLSKSSGAVLLILYIAYYSVLFTPS